MQERHCRKPWIFPIIGLIVLFWIFKSIAFHGFGHHGFGPHAFDFRSALMGLNMFLGFIVRVLGIILSIALVVQAFKSRAYFKAQAAQATQASPTAQPRPAAQPSAVAAEQNPLSDADDDQQDDPPATGDTVRL